MTAPLQKLRAHLGALSGSLPIEIHEAKCNANPSSWVFSLGFDAPWVGDLGVGALHPSLVLSFARACAQAQAWLESENEDAPLLLSIDMEYLPPLRPAELIARVELLRRGSGTISADVTVEQSHPKEQETRVVVARGRVHLQGSL